jgi:signal transduction histidine kinase
MKRKLIAFSRHYVTTLRKHLREGPQASLQPALALGRRAEVLDLATLDMARIHEGALATLTASDTRDGFARRAAGFFAEALIPIEKSHQAALKADARLKGLSARVARRTADLAASQRLLQEGIAQRKSAQLALKRSTNHSRKLLAESRRLQRRLQCVTHQLLSMQENKRWKISRQLHDEVAQALLGIHVRMVTLKGEAEVNARDLGKEIVSTQRLVDKSVKTIKHFAREFGIQPGT